MAGVPVGLDFGAIMAVAATQGAAAAALVAEALSDVETAILVGLAEQSED